jgi:hypothetical protein
MKEVRHEPPTIPPVTAGPSSANAIEKPAIMAVARTNRNSLPALRTRQDLSTVAVLDDVRPYDESNNVISLDHAPLHRQGRTLIAPLTFARACGNQTERRVNTTFKHPRGKSPSAGNNRDGVDSAVVMDGIQAHVESFNMMPTRALVPRVLGPSSAKRQRLSGPAASSSSRVSPRRAARSDDRSFQHVDHAVLQLWPFPTFYEDNDVEQSDAVNQHSQL